MARAEYGTMYRTLLSKGPMQIHRCYAQGVCATRILSKRIPLASVPSSHLSRQWQSRLNRGYAAISSEYQGSQRRGWDSTQYQKLPLEAGLKGAWNRPRCSYGSKRCRQAESRIWGTTVQFCPYLSWKTQKDKEVACTLKAKSQVLQETWARQ